MTRDYQHEAELAAKRGAKLYSFKLKGDDAHRFEQLMDDNGCTTAGELIRKLLYGKLI